MKTITAAATEHDRLYTLGASILLPLVRLEGREATHIGEAEKQSIRAGLRHMEGALALRPNSEKNSSTFWFIGKAHEALSESEKFYIAFKNACGLAPDDINMLRELAWSCHLTHRAPEFLEVALRASRVMPLNPGLLANLAFAYSANQRFEDARRVVDEALGMAPDDAKIIALARHIKSKQPPEPPM